MGRMFKWKELIDRFRELSETADEAGGASQEAVVSFLTDILRTTEEKEQLRKKNYAEAPVEIREKEENRERRNQGIEEIGNQMGLPRENKECPIKNQDTRGVEMEGVGSNKGKTIDMDDRRGDESDNQVIGDREGKLKLASISGTTSEGGATGGFVQECTATYSDALMISKPGTVSANGVFKKQTLETSAGFSKAKRGHYPEHNHQGK